MTVTIEVHFFGFILALLAAFPIIGFFIGLRVMMREAVAHGVAFYNRRTGKWEWDRRAAK